jgi:UDP-N-acetylmuramoyl-L-alanyl-D-glutamate--2,6-diaminopimelate ligase
MTIAELLKGLKVRRVKGPLEEEIRGIAYDSRLVKEGFIFVAVRGFSVDGHAYIKDAIGRGAVGVVLEKEIRLQSGFPYDLQNGIAFAEVDDSREALAYLASAFYKEPSKKLSLVGITGTNGKTTTSYILKSILEKWGKKVGLLGTINYIIGKKILPAPRTTPESLELQSYLRDMVDNGAEYAVIEISSHALELKRLAGCSFELALFTNFSQDHLDFHGTMNEYFAAKRRLFDCDYLAKNGYAILNWDDPMIRSLAGKLTCNLITCGFEKGAMIRAENIEGYRMQDTGYRAQSTPSLPLPPRGGGQGWGGLSFKIQTPEGSFNVSSRLIGRINIYNILMAAGAAYALGIDRDVIIDGIRDVKPIHGRFERIDKGQKFLCIVDYAHTEDALQKLIQEARLITKGRVITVFGCGGDRDKTKRPKMGAVAAGLSDFVILTSDNPRTEKPEEIIKEIMKGIKKDNYAVQPDRAGAIKQAVLMAETGDTLLVAGKGHEDYQEINNVRRPFSDKEVIEKAIQDAKPRN